MKNILNRYLPFAVVITAFCALAYATVQQAYRQGANDPQIQMARDAAYALEQGKTAEQVVPSDVVDMDRSLAPFLIVYNMDEQPVAASGLLNGFKQTVPEGVLGYAREKGENRVTWQPQPGTRIAAVIVPFKDGYVLAGRNLREVETREAQTTQFAGTTWILAMVATLIVIAFGERFLTDK
ncbi:MAG: hypothetical protein ACOYZ8_02930 [Chloroflexota bacterium]